ncbi:MAG: FapA family protein [Thermodesulfobacteriota bacterium]
MAKPSDKDKAIQSLDDIYREMFAGPDVEPATPAAGGETVPAATPGDPFAITITPDRMAAFLRASGSGAWAVGAEDIFQALHRHGVVFGVDREAVGRAARLLQTTGGAREALLVARGLEPTAGQEPQFPFLARRKDPATGQPVWLAEGQLLDFSALAQTLAASSQEEMARTVCPARVVLPDEVLAVLSRGGGPEPGTDVLGQPVAAEPPLMAGEHVRFVTADSSLRSMIYGYVHLEGHRLSVLSPLWIARDRMSAFLVRLPQTGTARPPTVQHLVSLLQLQGVSEGAIRQDRLEQAVAQLQQWDEAPRLVQVAWGFPPVPGRNARLTRFFETGVRAGTLKEGDFFDLKERHLVTSVRAKTVLAEKILATRGSPGADLFGRKLKTTDGIDIAIACNDLVATEVSAEKVLYIARVNGVVSFDLGQLRVTECLEVPGDVDYATGNIEVTTSLVIAGSVTAGFTVKAGGDLRIQGTVELGATVVAQGNLVVEQGIIGATTRVAAGGSLRTAFIQDASVVAKGDILVLSYIHSASIRSGGTVTVLKDRDGRGGKIVDCTVCATRGINASAVGSMASQNTLLALDNSPEDLAALAKIREGIKQASENILKLTRSLGISSVTPEHLKALLAAAPAEKREALVRLLQALNQTIKQRAALIEDERALAARMERDLGEGVIRVTGTFFQGNTVQIGQRRLVAPEDLSPATFQLRDGGIVY